MAERKLNINAPLMSVRRSSATPPSLIEAKKKILEKRHTLPYYKQDMTMDQVTEPVAVPFNWEHIPGRRKGNGGSEPQVPKATSITPSPRLPPGKSTNSPKHPLEKETKAASKFESSNKSKSLNVSVAKIDCERERKAEKIVEIRRSNVEEDVDDDVYSDALETLSPTESFSLNCSVSGVSGENLEAKKFGTFSTDEQTRDFMMSRFLPAAKAMTLQPPQYASKKQSVLVEQQPRDVSKLVREEKKHLYNRLTTDIIPYTGPSQEEESEDEGDDYDNSANISAKGCGLLPQLHIRNSLCLLNPVAGMKMKNQVPLSLVSEVGKPNKSSHIRSFSPVPAVKKAWDAIHKNKSGSGASSPDMLEGRKKMNSESNRFAYSGELLPGRLSPFRRSRAAATGISPCRSKPQSPFRGTKLLGDSKEAENCKSSKLKFYSGALPLGNVQDVLSQGAKRSSYSGNLTFEKTLYIDTASTVKFSSSNLSSVDNKRRVDTVAEDLDRRKGKGSNSTLESSQDKTRVQTMEEKDTFDSQVLSSIDSNPPTLYSILNLTAKEDKDEGLITDQNINQEPMSLPLVQGTFAEDSNTDTQQIVLANGLGKGGAESAVSPLPPPLPKSPSESWLWRALPLVSVKNSFLHSNQGTQSHAKRQDSNTASGNIKWETIVKTSNLHHDHVRYSQELPTHKSQHSKS
ncbi:uncharacterized protein LOC113872530 [Abrus precatorius]|uniref:Uncharacterized protein LOC113872530 n=1 Tax=Abrus precatorius TaxID=3816 RepID=A0A8B8MDP4_ABRPR|nr:uncharacterized protein LOC113872530 [Abrus precatorius]